MYQNVRLQEFIYKLINDESPLLTTKQGQPYLLNNCCNKNNKYIYHYLCKTAVQKKEFEVIQTIIKDNQEIFQSIKNTFLSPQNVCIVKTNYTNIEDNEMGQSFEDEDIIYSYFIHYGNFNNNLPISNFLKPIIESKPNNNIYKKDDSLKNRIESLKANGYEYTISTLEHAIILQGRYKNYKGY